MRLFLLLIVIAISGFPIAAQKSAGKTMSDLYNKDDSGACMALGKPFAGTVVKRNYADDEITLVGFVLREPGDERTFLNIDNEYVAGKGHFVPDELLEIIKVGKRVKVWVYECGASGRLMYLDKVQRL